MLACEAWEMPKVTQELVTGKTRMKASSNPCPYQDFDRKKKTVKKQMSHHKLWIHEKVKYHENNHLWFRHAFKATSTPYEL